MSIFFNFQVGPSGRRFRKAVEQDCADISAIWNKAETEKLFHDVCIGSLIELSTLAICLVNTDNNVTGFMALCDHPNVPAVDPGSWESWLSSMFQKKFIPRHTLFIHFMCCHDSVADFFLEEALVAVLKNDSYLRQILLVAPPDCDYDVLSKYQATKKVPFYKYYSKRKDGGQSNYLLYVGTRQDFYPKLKIRRCVEEDNDDIVEILDKKCPQMKSMYGAFYISEMIGRHKDGTRKIIVAQMQDKASAVMCLNSEINYKHLQAHYELSAFHGLMKPTSMEKEIPRQNPILKTFGEPVMLGKWSPFTRATNLENKSMIEDVPSKEKLEQEAKCTRVNFGAKYALRHSFDHLYKRGGSDDYSEDKFQMNSPSGSLADLSVSHLLDEDPFDYEIVNIDTSLFTLPEFSSTLLNQYKAQYSTRKAASKRRRRKSSIRARNEDPIPDYEGKPDAFMIELYGLKDGLDERRGFDLLEAAFECMKDYNYCIIRIPTTEKAMPLLQHFCYVPTRSDVNIQYSLYVAHRCSVLGKLNVRKAEFADFPQISNLLHTLDAKETFWTVEHGVENDKQHQAFVMTEGRSIIGIAILEPPEKIDFIRAKYTIDQHQIHRYHMIGKGVDSGYCSIKCILVYPAFEPHFKFFARELMRHSGSCTLIWLTAYRNKLIVNKANVMTCAMVPLISRKTLLQIKISPELRTISNVAKSVMAFSTWFISKKLTSVPKVYVDTRIVIVGASRTAMAFLNTLLFCDSVTYLTFTNVTLVSPNGLPYLRHYNPTAEMMFPKFRTNSDRFLKSTPYTYYVNVVHGTMVEIDKQEKYITLDNGGMCHYDFLFLLIGKQYQHPDYMEYLLEKDRQFQSGQAPYVRLDVPRYIETEPQLMDYDTPDNVFIINHVAEAAKALSYVKNLAWQSVDDDYRIIVYGNTIHAYCCISALLELNILPENIVFVEPFPSENSKQARVSLFCNMSVDQTVREVLDELKITVYRSTYFDSWELDEYDNLITHANFLSYHELVRLECNAFFYYGKRGVSPHAFVALNKCGVAYDGGILIDHEFRTKEPSIYAAGPATRYYARYFAQSKRQKYYDSYEVGKMLGAQIRNQLDPLFMEPTLPPLKARKFQMKCENSETCDTSDQQSQWHLPDLKKPLVWHCVLPGSMHYLEVRPPGQRIPHHYVQSLGYDGYVMETVQKGYFKLHLTRDYIVDGITCLTSERQGLESFKVMYGLAAAVLNNVHFRYYANKISCLFDFFRAPWAVFLYHEQLEETLAMVKELVPTDIQSDDKKMTLEEALRSANENIELDPMGKDSMAETKYSMRCNFEKSAHFKAITDFVIDWLRDNDVVLPMYLHPTQLVEFTHDLRRHPCFRKKKINITKSLNKMLLKN